jgi:uncharacterized ferritin-like protein (DUF455 family)
MITSALYLSNVYDKLNNIESECHRLLIERPKVTFALGTAPARDLEIVTSLKMPARAGLQSPEGQARLLHNLANIELQAMELGLRTLYEFSDAPEDFRSGMVSVVLDEARHLKLCLDGVRDLGFEWGAWPAHNSLWNSTSADDSIIDRLLIVNCYLEASGLDSSELLLRRLNGVENPLAKKVVDVIAREEVGHVRFGLNWYRLFCKQHGIESSDDFSTRLNLLAKRIPPRIGEISVKARKNAGFSDDEIQFISEFALRQLN